MKILFYQKNDFIKTISVKSYPHKALCFGSSSELTGNEFSSSIVISLVMIFMGSLT